jgi:hypothetical protein
MIFPFILCLLLGLSAPSNQTGLEWDQDRPLIWSDFSGTIDEESDYVAYTYSYIEYDYTWNMVDGQMAANFNVRSLFIPEKSWLKKGNESVWLLNHEQKHFDINEIHARHLREKFQTFSFTENIAAETDSIFNEVLNAKKEMEIVYDEETNHGLNEKGQLIWNDFIREELIRMDSFSK